MRVHESRPSRRRAWILVWSGWTKYEGASVIDTFSWWRQAAFSLVGMSSMRAHSTFPEVSRLVFFRNRRRILEKI